MIWRHLLGYLPANIIAGLVSFGGVYVFTRLLGGEDYGRYALVATGMHLGHTLALTWSEAAAYRFTGEAARKGDMADHVRTSLYLALLSIIPALALIALGWLAAGHDPRMQAAIVWLGVSMPAMSIVQTSMEIRKASQNVARYSLVAMTHALTGFAIGICAAWFLKAGAASPFIGLAVSAGFLALMEGTSLWRMSAGGRFNWRRVKRYFAYGAPVAAALVLELGLGAGDRFLIAGFLDTEAVGAYAAGYGVADQTIRLLCMWGAMAGAPLLMAAYEANGPDGVREPGLAMARMFLLIAAPAAAGIAMVAQPLAEFMVGEDLRAQAADIMPWIAAAGFMNGLIIYYFSEAFQLAHRTGLRAGLMIVPVVLNIVLNVILLPRIGLMGAVYATVACYGVALILVAGVGRRLAPLPIPAMDIAKTGASCLVMYGVVRLLPAIGAFPELILKAGCGAAAFSITAYLLNAAGARDMLSDLKGRVQRA